MMGVKRACPARWLCAAGAVAITIPVAASVSAQVRRNAFLSRILDRTQAICKDVRPDLRTVHLDVTPLKSIRSGEPDRDTWSVQISDDQDEYVGATIWDAETGQLTSASWRDDSPRTEEGVGGWEVGEIAKMRLRQMDIPLSRTPFRTVKGPQRAGRHWIVWFGNGPATSQYRVKVESTNGRLVSAERRKARS